MGPSGTWSKRALDRTKRRPSPLPPSQCPRILPCYALPSKWLAAFPFLVEVGASKFPLRPNWHLACIRGLLSLPRTCDFGNLVTNRQRRHRFAFPTSRLFGIPPESLFPTSRIFGTPPQPFPHTRIRGFPEYAPPLFAAGGPGSKNQGNGQRRRKKTMRGGPARAFRTSKSIAEQRRACRNTAAK